MYGLISHINDFELHTKDYEKSSRSFVGKQFNWIHIYISAPCGNLDLMTSEIYSETMFHDSVT